MAASTPYYYNDKRDDNQRENLPDVVISLNKI